MKEEEAARQHPPWAYVLLALWLLQPVVWIAAFFLWVVWGRR